MQPDWHRDGFAISPVLLDAASVARTVAGLERVIRGEYRLGREPKSRSQPPGPPGQRMIKIDMPHLCDPDILAAVTHPALAAWACAITGSDALQAWAVQLLWKPPGPDEAVAVGWHQDSLYWPYWEGEVLTAWLALGDVGADCGPVRMVPGSHRWGAVPAGDFFTGDLAATRRAIESRGAGPWREQAVLLPAGAASLHHRHTVHGSGSNSSGRPRLSLAIHVRTQAAMPKPGADDWFIRDLDDPAKAPWLHPPADHPLVRQPSCSGA